MKRLVLASVSGAIIGALIIFQAFTTPAAAMLLPHLAIIPPPAKPPKPAVLTIKVRPPPPRVILTVRAGDTLSQIAASNGTSWIDLAVWNHMTDPNLILAGQRLAMPPAWWKPDQYQITVYDQLVYGQVVTFTSQQGSEPVSRQAHNLESQGATPGPATSFQACVEFRESTDGELSSDLYGILQSTWTANGFPGSPYTASASEQAAAFQAIYAADGTQPWAPYDGC